MRFCAAALALAVGCSVSAARADTQLVLSDEGGIGAWLVAAPVRAGSLSGLQARAGAEVGGAAFAPVADASGRLSLVRLAGRGSEVIAAVTLLSPTAGRSWLLVSTEASGEVWLGGERIAELWPRGAAHVWQPIPLQLVAGSHPLLLRLRIGSKPPSLAVRWVDAGAPGPPRDARALLAGVPPGAAVLRELLKVEFDAVVRPGAVLPRLAVPLRGGAPVGVARAVRVAEATGAPVALGGLALGATGAHRFEALLPPVSLRDGAPPRLQFAATVGDVSSRHALHVEPSTPGLVQEAERVAAALSARSAGPGLLAPSWLGATLRGRARELATARNQAASNAAGERLRTLLADLAQGRDPLAQPGVHDLYRPSVVDGEPDGVSLHVPVAAGTEKRPLVVLLHGLGGTPASVMRVFLDSTARGPRVAGYVLAPHAHGDTFFRGPGEREVLGAIDEALQFLPIDPERVSITGVSMGGTGSAFIGLRHAERFSAAAPLCGYHSFFVRRDTSKRPLRAWEKARMHHWSPASLAAGGNDLPLYVAHGTKDFPLENSRVLIQAYRSEGYDVTEEWPDTGHAVWEKTYAGARLFGWLAGKRRAASPARIVVESDSYARGRRGWAEITRLASPGHAGRLDARVTAPGRIEVRTRDISGFALHAPPGVGVGDIQLEVDGNSLSAPASALAFRKTETGWTSGEDRPSVGEKRAGVEGPVRAVFDDPVIFSFGTGDPGALVASREVASAWARRYGPEVAYSVVADTALADEVAETHHVVVVGTPSGHAWLRRFDPDLPVRVEGEALTAAGRRVAHGGAIYATPSRIGSSRTWVVITGVDAGALLRALALPALLPDFLIWDRSFRGAAGEQVLGDEKVVLSGFFDSRWRWPADPRDRPEAPDAMSTP
ncbi:MAG: hypothetical protein KF718_11245 [Polyangiaceae bacterium]|nr:hypothetical protein [Polyangiaceae bacterium]